MSFFDHLSMFSNEMMRGIQPLAPQLARMLMFET